MRARLAAPVNPVHPPVEPAVTAAAATRAEVSKLGIALRKSYKVKEFNDKGMTQVPQFISIASTETGVRELCKDIGIDEAAGFSETIRILNLNATFQSNTLKKQQVGKISSIKVGKDVYFKLNDVLLRGFEKEF